MATRLEGPLQQDADVDNDDTATVDCPICLDPMSEADLQHPLQCTRHCGYNFCRTCISSLISSSQDDYVEASDGNRHVKVFLSCPNCRSDLSESIRDTLLLRRAHVVLQNEPMSDDSMQRALKDDLVQTAVEEARLREAEFFGNQAQADKEEVENFGEEWGVEADLIRGVHSSFRLPKPPPSEEKKEYPRVLLIDKTLFAGLDYFMPMRQQERMTDLMTSGDPAKLAEAAEILRQVADMFHQGEGERRASVQRRGSVYELVRQAQKARDSKQQHPAQRRPSNKYWQHKRMEMEMRQEAAYLRTHPLPVRMPKCVQLRVHPLSLRFCDDVWDGTVKDAFCKLTIGIGGRVSRNETQHRGVRNILGGYGSVRIDMEKPRVLVSSVKGEGGQQGVMRGDVVTHLNGELFEGNAKDLEAQIRACSGPTFQLVLNAGQPVAEALKRRAMLE